MAEQPKAKSFEDLMKQVTEFESTIKSLAGNVANLKKKLTENRDKYGPDMTVWPKE